MSNYGEIAIDLRMKGSSINDVARVLKVTPGMVSRVSNGQIRSKRVEKYLISRGCAYLLKKAQVKNGIFDAERFEKLVTELNKEKNGK